jgi:acetyltransferase-like isoleucine patch superfamily enzyme
MIFIGLYILDAFFTNIYCRLQKRKDEKLGGMSSQKPQYTLEEVLTYRFPKKQIKWLFHLYKGWIRYKLFRLGTRPSHSYRKFILRHIYLMVISDTSVLYGGFEIRDPWKISIGEGSIIGDESKLDGRNGLTIGKNVNFSTGVWIWTEEHDVNDENFMSNKKGGPVIIGDRAWISSRTVIIPNTHIGTGSVIAAGAVVTKDTEPYSIYGGVPAIKIGDRNQNLKYIFHGEHEFFY